MDNKETVARLVAIEKQLLALLNTIQQLKTDVLDSMNSDKDRMTNEGGY